MVTGVASPLASTPSWSADLPKYSSDRRPAATATSPQMFIKSRSDGSGMAARVAGNRVADGIADELQLHLLGTASFCCASTPAGVSA